VLVKRDEVPHHALVEAQRALVLGERRGLGLEARDDVVAVLATSDRVGELTTPPVIDGDLAGGVEEPVKAVELLLDGGVFERRIEDVHRLILARHVESSLWSGAAPRPCPTRGGGCVN
jgi:hypothetical protein